MELKRLLIITYLGALAKEVNQLGTTPVAVGKQAITVPVLYYCRRS
jgi:hypothetical protein